MFLKEWKSNIVLHFFYYYYFNLFSILIHLNVIYSCDGKAEFSHQQNLALKKSPLSIEIMRHHSHRSQFQTKLLSVSFQGLSKPRRKLIPIKQKYIYIQ